MFEDAGSFATQYRILMKILFKSVGMTNFTESIEYGGSAIGPTIIDQVIIPW